MRKAAAVLLALFIAAAAPAAALQVSDNIPVARAQRAMKMKDYKAAIDVCLFHLAVTPDDYDLKFLLAQAYAFSGRSNEALEVLARMRAAEPRNTDVLLLESRVLSWKKRTPQALAGYEEILRIDPGNAEALIGIADIAAWRGDRDRARALYGELLERDPGNAEIHYRLGLVAKWDGNYGLARESIDRAVALAPGNEDYRTALTAAAPRLQAKREVRYGHTVDAFSDDRAAFQSDRLALHLGLPGGAGPLIVKAGRTLRAGERDFQLGLEAYPRLWPRAYGRVELDASPRAVHYPSSSVLAEVYQGFLTAGEASLGVWHMRFPSRPVTVYLGSLGWYLGNYYPYARFNYSSEAGRGHFSWSLQLRRYFSDENFIYAGFGRGSRPFESAALQDLLEVRAGILSAGVVWYAFERVRIEVHYGRTSEPALVRNTVQVAAGWRWR